MVSLIPYFKKAVEAGIDENLMADWIVDFFKTDDGASISEDYNMPSQVTSLSAPPLAILQYVHGLPPISKSNP